MINHIGESRIPAPSTSGMNTTNITTPDYAELTPYLTASVEDNTTRLIQMTKPR